MQVGSLYTSLTLESQSFVVGLKRAVAQTQTSVASIEANFNKLKNAAQIVAGALALDAAAGAAGRALDYASSLGEVAQQLGITTKDLQVYRFAATQAGIQQEVMDKALAKLTVTLGQARDGAKGPAEAFRELSRLAGRDIVSSAQSAGDAIPMIAEALGKVSDPAKRARLEVELFGKAGQKLDTLLANGRGQIDELRNAAMRLGVVLDDRLINQADEAADKLAAMKQVLEAQIARTVAENADSLVTLANGLMTLTSAITQFLNSHPEKAVGWIGALAGARTGFAIGRIGGIPGAIAGTAVGAGIGATAGYALGGGYNPDLDERIQASEARLKRQSWAGGNALGGPVRAREEANLRRLRAEKAEAVLQSRFGGQFTFGGTPPVSPAFAGASVASNRAGGRGKAGRTAEDPFAHLEQSIRNTLDAIGADEVDMTIRPIIRADRNSSDALQMLYDLSKEKSDIPIDISFDGADPSDIVEKAKQALQTYQNSLREIAAEHAARMEDTTRSVASLYQSLFRGGTRALWGDFKNIGTQVIAELMAKFTIAKLTGKSFDLGGALSSTLTAAGFGGFFANGGRPPVGKVSVVGERGPELFLPNVSGTIIPNHALGGAPIVVHVQASEYFDARVERVSVSANMPIMQQIGQASVVGGAGLARSHMAQAASRRLGR